MYYIVVEGDVTEMEIYLAWLKYTRPRMEFTNDYTKIDAAHYHMLSGHGNPAYLKTISDAMDNIKTDVPGARLIIIVDSEEMNYQDKYDEINNHIKNKDQAFTNYRIIIQHFCIETWLLANRTIFHRSNIPTHLASFYAHCDLRQVDPEALNKPVGGKFRTRARYAHAYLKAVLRSKSKIFSKSNPECAKDKYYLDMIRKHHNNDGIIPSFTHFIQELG